MDATVVGSDKNVQRSGVSKEHLRFDLVLHILTDRYNGLGIARKTMYDPPKQTGRQKGC